jgi:hypothetical protein
VTTVQEIEAAIEKLAPEERAKLAESLPRLVPELDGDARWAEIINDPAPRPALQELGDRLDAAMREDPHQFPEITEEEFEKHS